MGSNSREVAGFHCSFAKPPGRGGADNQPAQSGNDWADKARSTAASTSRLVVSNSGTALSWPRTNTMISSVQPSTTPWSYSPVCCKASILPKSNDRIGQRAEHRPRAERGLLGDQPILFGRAFPAYPANERDDR